MIVYVHGCCTNEGDVNKLKEQLSEAYKALLQKPGKWEIVLFDWHLFTPKPDLPPFYSKELADIAYIYARSRGQELADDINIVDARNIIQGKQPYKYIHLIAHSSGSELIDQAAKWLALEKERKNDARQKPFIQLTFLDAYTPFGKGAKDRYGSLPNDYLKHYSEHYVDKGFPFSDTDETLPNAFNFDITRWTHWPWEGGFFGHSWPVSWYIKSITAPEPEFKYLKYGHPLSREGGNGKFINVMGQLYLPGDLITLATRAPALGVPVITKVDFPSSIIGDGRVIPGTVEFTDSNKGVNWIQFDRLGDTCGGCTSSWGFDPGVSDVRGEGQFGFLLRCTSGSNGFFSSKKLTLRDRRAPESNPYIFLYECKLPPISRSLNDNLETEKQDEGDGF